MVKADPVITLTNVTVIYSESEPLSGVNFEVLAGEFVGIMGPNGAGKTTLLKAIMGLVPVNSGKVEVLGVSGARIKRIRTRIGYVPQKENIDPWFPIQVFDVVLMGRYSSVGPLRRITEIDKNKVRKVLTQVGMQKFAYHAIGHLSGGQQRRILLARALVKDPDILLLDEPTTGIDVGAQQEIINLLEHIHQERKQTVLCVTHDINRIAPLLDKVAFIDGCIKAYGSLREVLKKERLESIYHTKALVHWEQDRPYVVIGDFHG